MFGAATLVEPVSRATDRVESRTSAIFLQTQGRSAAPPCGVVLDVNNHGAYDRPLVRLDSQSRRVGQSRGAAQDPAPNASAAGAPEEAVGRDVASGSPPPPAPGPPN